MIYSSQYNNTYNKTIKIKHIDVKTRAYIDFDIDSNDKNPTF